MQPSEYVNNFVGTGYHGHTFPGATTPFGLVQLSPDTRTYGWDGCSGYHYSDSTILGFSHTHLSGTGCADLGDFMFTPLAEPTMNPRPYEFRHSDEKACPGYYSVRFRKEGIKAELTATSHVGLHRYTGARAILIDIKHNIGDNHISDIRWSKDSRGSISGSRTTHGWSPDRTISFSANFSLPIESVKEEDGKVLVVFPKGTKEIIAAVGISYNGEESAYKNVLLEASKPDFDQVLTKAKESWKAELGKIKIEGGSRKQRETFYTALYHCFIAPNLISDAEEPERYSTLSLWDTFRSWNPLMTLISPGLTVNVVRSMLDFYDRTGTLPMWPLGHGETSCMIGYHSVSVIADAYLSGIRGFDAEHALEAMIKASDSNGEWSKMYNLYGYVPCDLSGESVSRTMEFAYDDWCIARMAEVMGKEDIAAGYYARCTRYRELFDSSTGFFRGKDTGGHWVRPFDTIANRREYTEAIPWQYRFFAPHDVKGIECLMGGRESLVAALDSLFIYDKRSAEVNLVDMTGMIGQYAHGNEPSHNFAYLFSYVGQPWKTQSYVRRILEELYAPTPEGIAGNEDCGQMSAWYVLSAIGLYPACPGSQEFILTSPIFKKVIVGDFTITVDNPSEKYIQSAVLNGQELEGSFINSKELNGCLEIKLGSKPGETPAREPYSYTAATFVSTPGSSADFDLFRDKVLVEFTCPTPDAAITCYINNIPFRYTEPFWLDKTCNLDADAEVKGMDKSGVFRVKARKAEIYPARMASGIQPGLEYLYKEGPFRKTADVLRAPVAAKGSMPEPSIAGAHIEDHFGYIFYGLLDIPQEGIWSFRTISDDGSVLYIDGHKVVDNDGGHAAIEASGKIGLAKGWHSFRLVYFEDYEGQCLDWAWKAPGPGTFSKIPTDNIFHE